MCSKVLKKHLNESYESYITLFNLFLFKNSFNCHDICHHIKLNMIIEQVVPDGFNSLEEADVL
jgi:hypothetical protein